MNYQEALNQYDLLISIVSDLAVLQDVDWEQDEHLAALEVLRGLVENSKDGG